MKIVIDIPEEDYLNLIKTDENGEKEIPLGLLMSLWDNVKYNCVHLPKGHGRLVDADKAKEDTEEWISVSERLPERDVDVLAYVIGVGIKYQRVMWIDDCTGEWVGFVGSGYKDRVIAWMPLPEPYTESEEEE